MPGEHPDEHPDELLHRARRGLPLSPQEMLLRLEHLRLCAACRFLEEARVDLLNEAAPPANGKTITELVAATMASFEARAPQDAAAPSRQPLPRGGHMGRRVLGRTPALAAALVCMVAGVALAAHWIAATRMAGHLHPDPTPAPDPARRSRVVSPRASVPQLPPSVPLLPRASDELPAAAPPASERPAALFARATEARRDGRVDEARRAYNRLWREFPGTPEAQTGRVAYGRWLLDRNEAQPAALAFGDYLRSAPDGALATEASVGLAEALELLGDWPRARRAWQDVLSNPAAGMHASHAKARIRALDALVREGAANGAGGP